MTEKPDFGRLMKGVIPYVTVKGAQDAAEYYKKAFGAVQHMPAALSQDGRVLNIGLEINGGTMMLMDAFPEMDPTSDGAPPKGCMMVIVTLDGDMWWNRAMAAGCSVRQTFEKQFWGDRYGRLQDPYGVEWAINEPSAENIAASRQV